MHEEITDETSEKSNDDDAILKIARERFKYAEEQWKEIYDAAEDDHRFANGEQWPEDVRRAREQESRPCLTINRIDPLVRQVTNDQRQNRPAIRVSPVDDLADVDTAKVQQGLIRHIEYSSDADFAYDHAFEDTVKGGLGWFRVVTEYCDPYSFEQEIRIKPIKNWRSAYLDPDYQSPDGRDANWGFVHANFAWDEYRNQYPDSKIKGSQDYSNMADVEVGWHSSDTVRVVEYFYKEYEQKTLVLLNDKTVIEKPLLPSVLPEGIKIEKERPMLVPTVYWVKTNGVEILDKTIWPGQYIPIIPVIGKETFVDGKRMLEGLVRQAKDAQRMLNYWKSSETEAIALAPKAPWIIAEGQLEGHERIWKDANKKSHPYLPYKPVALNGSAVAPPQRNSFEPAVQAITQAAMFAGDDIKTITGIYDAAIGARSNENSGIAIQRRANQAQTSNFHFVDNLSKSIRHCGRILVDLIPHIYDTERAVRTLGEDGKEEIVKINAVVDPELEPNAKTYDINKGKYDVTVATGPSYETKRQESLAAMLELSKSMPVIGQAAPDLMVKAMDFPMSNELAERIARTLPPNLTQDKDKQAPIPPEAQAQMEQMGQMIEQLTQQVSGLTDERELKVYEIETKKEVELAKIEKDYRIKMAELDAVDARVQLEAEIAQIQAQQNRAQQIQDQELAAMGNGPDQPMPMHEQQPLTGEQQPPASVEYP